MKVIGIAVVGMLAVAGAQSLYAQVQGTWTISGSMNTPREQNAQASLKSGEVLAAGGLLNNSRLTATAEIFNPALGTWTSTGSMHTARWMFPAVELNNGKVLVEGGYGNNGVVASAELFDPATGTWSSAGTMSVARDSHAATLLPDGDVLVTGGCTASACTGTTAVSEIYHVTTNTWSVSGSLNTARAEQSALLLKSGQVMVVGGVTSGNLSTLSAELYTPSTGKWSNTASTNGSHHYGALTLLADGKVLITGGLISLGTIIPPRALNAAELYNPVTNTWTLTGNMVNGRYNHTSTLLPDGTVLVAAGDGVCGTNCAGMAPITSAEIYNEALGTFSSTESLYQAHANQSATALPNGSVLLDGGYEIPTSCCEVSGESEIYTVGHASPSVPRRQ